MELFGPKLKNLLYFRRELAKPEKQTNKICSDEISYIFRRKFSSHFGMTADQAVELKKIPYTPG